MYDRRVVRALSRCMEVSEWCGDMDAPNTRWSVTFERREEEAPVG